MFGKTEIKNLENAKIISYRVAGRNSSIPSGTLFKDVIIENAFEDLKFDTLYVPDAVEIGKRGPLFLIKKSGKYLISPADEKSEENALKSFREYYRANSKEAFIFLFMPIVIIGTLLGIFSGLPTLKVYTVMTFISFMTRAYTFKSVGDIFLCASAPTYIYLLLRF